MEDLFLDEKESFVYESLETGGIISEDSVETVYEEAEEADDNWGTVVNCNRLNIREEPSPQSTIISKLKNGEKVILDFDDSTDEFYKVYTEIGLEGFCSKKFIELGRTRLGGNYGKYTNVHKKTSGYR